MLRPKSQKMPMSILTVQLVPASKVPARARHWLRIFTIVTDRLVAEYGVPSLGNFRDPVQEIFYITLSARTTDSQYRKTHRALRAKYPTLTDLAMASVEEILSCIRDGGLGKKRAAQVRGIAVELLRRFGSQPSRHLRKLSSREAFDVLNGLPGMGPKSALCVMMYSLNYDTFPVDTNVQRVASRLGALAPRLKHWQAQQRLAAALSNFFAVKLYSFFNSSREPSTAAMNCLICTFSAFLTARLCRRRFSDLRKFFLALCVCGIAFSPSSLFHSRTSGKKAL